MIKLINKQHIEEVAKIHKENLPSILTYYPLSAIKRFYKVQFDNNEILIGYESHGKIVGFAFGTENVDHVFPNFISSNRTQFLIDTTKAIFTNPKLIFFFLNKMFSKTESSDCKAHFVYMSLNKELKGSGIGFLLTKEFEKILKERNLISYEFEVEANNPAMRFHLKNKSVIVKEVNNLLERKFIFRKDLK